MKKIVFIIFLCLVSFSLFSQQTKLLIDDVAGILDPITDSLLVNKLAESNIKYVSILDYKRRCDYNYATIGLDGKKVILDIKDCNDNSLGSKDLGSSIAQQNTNEKTIILKYAIADILENPGEYVYSEKPKPVFNQVSPDIENVQQEEIIDTRPPVTKNQHTSRYFFTPSAFNLQEGELYYNSLYFLIHDAQYGISNNFSIGLGTTVMGFPFYLTPKLTLFHNDKIGVAVGDIMMLGTWGISFFGNIAYGVVTLGDQYNNISFGAGSFYLSGDEFGKSHKPIGNLSFMVRLSDYFYFVTENYVTGFVDEVERIEYTTVWMDDPYSSDPAVGWYYDEPHVAETINRKNPVLFGITGIRFINKTKDVVSYQFGIAYLGIWPEAIPARFDEWDYRGDLSMAFPMIGYTKKFGLKY
ncbi:MAG: hypothetical protein JXA77_01830 [Bacteroidales bacterium]|nr:hypothetical protein [Bacteroidales bacterium]MBN2818902.1 hypothetical protein [Bacteroidales bacterium]